MSSSNTVLMESDPADTGDALDLTATTHDETSSTSSALPDVSRLPTSRSCIICYRRKVRCDKGTPCSNCARQNTWCTYPDARSYGPRKPRAKPTPMTDILDRLQRLESRLEAAAAGSSNSSSSTRAESPPASRRDDDSRSRADAIPLQADTIRRDRNGPVYYSDRFVATVLEENESEHDAPDVEPDQTSSLLLTSGTGTPLPPPAVNASNLPTTGQAILLFNAFVSNVDPAVKVLHIPTFTHEFYAALHRLDAAPADTLALMYTVFYGATVSMDSLLVQTIFGTHKSAMLAQFRQGLDGALANLNILVNPTMKAVQALTVFLNIVRVNDTSRAVWNLTGLTVRIAYSMGLHKDGSTLGLSPFVTEARRRTWWHLIVLDARSQEDHGVSVPSAERVSTTRYPLNINDSDLYPTMTEPPHARQEWTDTSFSLLRIEEVDTLFRDLLASFHKDTKIDTEAVIERLRETITNKVLRYATHHTPAQVASELLLKHSINKARFIMTLSMYQADPTSDMLHQLLLKACCVVEDVVYILDTEELARPFRWFFRAYTQWYAISFIYRRLCMLGGPRRSDGSDAAADPPPAPRDLVDLPTLERGWNMVERLFVIMSDDNQQNSNPIWLAVVGMREKARRALQTAFSQPPPLPSAEPPAAAAATTAAPAPPPPPPPPPVASSPLAGFTNVRVSPHGAAAFVPDPGVDGLGEFDFDAFMTDDFPMSDLVAWPPLPMEGLFME